MNLQVHRISSLSDFINLMERSDSSRVTLFRGQTTDKDLFPKIARFSSSEAILDLEQRMFHEFALEAIQYLRHKPDNDLQMLTIAQHFGVPTRLLDWTENALTALYFSVSAEPKEYDTAIIWMLSFNYDNRIIINDNEIDNIFEVKQIKFFKPPAIVERITFQHGWFSIHPFEKDTYKKANDLDDGNIRIQKFIINENCSETIRSALEKCGINRYTIFRDLDSLGLHILEKYQQIE